VEDVPGAPPQRARDDDFELPGQRSAVAAAGAALAGAPAAAPGAPGAGAGAPATADGARPAGEGGAEEAMPEWWSPSPRLSVSAAYREQARPQGPRWLAGRCGSNAGTLP